jgi:aminoglycoside 3-N-acetyltransferase
MLRKKIYIEKRLHILFKRLNIKRNDNVFLHTNSAGILQYTKSKKNKKKLFTIFFNLLLKKIGQNGTLVLPTYNYDFAKGKSFVYENYNSQVGELSNFFLKEHKVQRSLDPIFSHAIKGKLQNKLLRSKVDICFGDESLFKKIHDYNFKIFGFCCPLNKMTFLHYIEKKMEVNYRFNKKFVSTFIKKSKKQKIELKYFVGKKNIDYKLKDYKLEKAFKNLKNFLSCDFGKFYCWTINAKECFEIIKKKISKKNNYLIK